MPLALAEIRRLLRKPNALALIRSAAYPEPRPEPARPQLALWIVDGDGLPPRPWLICGDSQFDCLALGCKGMCARVCVARQAASDAQRTRDTWRGQGFDHPSCVTEKCAQGRAIRAVLDPTHAMRWRGAGPNARFGKGRSDAVEQYEARCRLEAVGLLAEVPTVDTEPFPVESGDDGQEACQQAKSREPKSDPAAGGAPLQAGAEREPEGPPGVGEGDARGVRAPLARGASEGRRADDRGGGRESPTRGRARDPRPGGSEAVLGRAGQARGDGPRRRSARSRS
jgi:hypothetical protein